MSRLNGKRRRELALLRARNEFAQLLNPTSQADTGQVRSSHKVNVANQVVPAVARAYSPKPINYDDPGKPRKRPKSRPPVQTFGLTSRQIDRARFKGSKPAPLGAQTLPTDTGDGDD